MKKIVSILISIIIAVSFITSFADNSVTVTNEKYEQAIDIINALGIKNKMSANSKDSVTRGEFLYTLISTLRIDVDAATDMVYFSDTKDHFSNAATVAAREIGIISEAEFFNPDAEITLSQAVKMCIIASGYQIQAASYGGYPEGYLIAAMFAGHMDGVKVDSSDRGLTVYEAMILLYNTMNVDLMKRTMYGDSYEFEKIEGNNILSEYYSVYELTGVLSRTSRISVDYYSEPTQDGKIAVGDTVLSYNGDCDELLGQNVSVYYEAYDGNKTALSITPIRNNVIYASAQNFKFNGNVLTLNDIEYKINRSYAVVLNGRAYTGSLESALNGATSVRLVSNNYDNVYDIIFVDVVKYTYVSYVDYENKVIYDANSPDNNIYLNDKNIYYTVFDSKSEEYTTFDSIESETVIGSVASDDGQYVKITMYSGEISGKVSEIDYTNDSIYFDDQEYKISSYFEEYYTDISLGINYDILLGDNGELVVPVATSTSMKFGILVDMEDNGSALKQPKIKIFTEQGNMIVSNLAKKVFVDNRNMPASEVVSLLAPGGVANRQLIRYELGETGDVLYIDTKEPGDPFNRPETGDLNADSNEYDSLRLHRFGEPDASAEGDNPTDSDIPTKVYTYMYKSSGSMFYPKFNAGNATVFVIPTESNASDDEKYEISSNDAFDDDDEYTDLEVLVYNIDEYGVAEVIVYINDANTNTPKSSTKSAVVEKVSLAYDETDDEIKRKVSVWSQGRFYTYFLDENVSINKTSGNDLCPGDIIRFTYVDNTIVSVVVDFDATPNVFTNNGSVSFNGKNSSIQYQKGMLYSLKGSYAYIDPAADAISGEYEYNFSNLKHFTIATSNVLIINMNRTESGLEFVSLQPANASELISYKSSGNFADYVVLRQRYLSPEVMFVYRITDK